MVYKLTSNSPSKSAYWSEIWKKRELVLLFAKRDILVRYGQTTFGILWALFRPLLNTLALFFAFSFVKKNGASLDFSYSLFILSGLVPWLFISGTLHSASILVLNHTEIVSKIFFPKILLSLSSIAVNFLDFLIGFALLSLTTLFFNGGNFLFFPYTFAGTLLALLLNSALALWVSALTLRFRDLIFIIPFFIQLGVFFCPIVYPIANASPMFQWLLCFNPATAIIMLFHKGVLDIKEPLFFEAQVLGWTESFFLLWSAMRLYRKKEHLTGLFL